MADTEPLPSRAYYSPLRDDRARRTREAIVEALVEQVADAGLTDFSVPKVAKRAGVSVRTVYRYFPTRDDLLLAVDEYWKRGSRGIVAERAEDLPRTVRESFEYFDEIPDRISAALHTHLGRATNEAAHQERTERIARLLAPITGNLSEEDRLAAIAVVRVVHSARIWQSMREDFAMDGSQSGRAVEWALSVLIDDIRRRNEAAGTSGGCDDE